MSILPYNSWILSFGSVEEKMNREGSIRMIICKRSFYPVDHLQEVVLSCWSFAIDWSIEMIICKWPVIPDDHLQEAAPSRWSFARGLSIRKIICKRMVHPDDQLHEACPSGWSFARGRCPLHLDDHLQEAGPPGRSFAFLVVVVVSFQRRRKTKKETGKIFGEGKLMVTPLTDRDKNGKSDIWNWKKEYWLFNTW